MVVSCVVIGCTHRHGDVEKDGKKIGFHRIPAISKRGDAQTVEYSKERRAKWVNAIRRENVTAEMNLDDFRVCSTHFREGDYFPYELPIFQGAHASCLADGCPHL